MRACITKHRGSQTLRAVSICVMCAGLCLAEPAVADEELPTLEQMQLPTFEELMSDNSFDWVVLKSGGVIVTDPLSPRPDTLKKMTGERDQLEAASGEGTIAEREARRNRLMELRYLVLTLPGDADDHRIELARIDRVISFEELMLRRVDALLVEGDIARAYQLIRTVELNAPDWEPTAKRFRELLFREAEVRLADGDRYACIALLEEIASQYQDDPRVSRLMGQTVDELAEAAVNNANYGKARYLLSRLSKLFPRHAVTDKWEKELLRQMGATLSEANNLFKAGEFAAAATRAEEANRRWQTTGASRSLYGRIISRYQRLRVPVTSFSGAKVVSPIETSADRRHAQLTEVSLFEPESANDLTYFRSNIFDIWNPQDLGREVLFSLRQSRAYWESQPVLSANQIADTLSRQLDSASAHFNPRMASFVKRFSARSPTQLHVSFHRVPLRLEALFRFPVTVQDAKGEPELLSHRFKLAESTDQRRVYRRVVPEPDGLAPTQYHIAEIVEQKYPTRHATLQAFTRGEIDIIPHLLPWEIEPFLLSGIGFVRQYAIPQNHIIVFNPQSKAVQSSQLRRALSFGVDREKMLEIVILRDPDMKYGRPNSAPWHTESYASNPVVKEPAYDHYLSYLLRFAAEEQLKLPTKQKFVAAAKASALAAEEEWDEDVFRITNADEIDAAAAHITLPTLRLICEADEVAQLACERMVKRWRLLGFDIELIRADTEGEQLGDDEWDMMYRVTRMHEPLLDLWPVLLTDDNFDVNKLNAYPDWMRQELINLDYSTSFKDAQERLFRIHRKMEAQAFLIPLWELDDYIVFRRELAGTRERPIKEYDNVEQWSLRVGGGR